MELTDIEKDIQKDRSQLSNIEGGDEKLGSAGLARMEKRRSRIR
jgi:hypothetical protein